MFLDAIIVLLTVLTAPSLAKGPSSAEIALPVKRAAMAFQGAWNDRGPASSKHDDFSKRAGMGFQGMGGKTECPDVEPENSYIRDDYDKRAPMGFQKMRGKKAIDNDDHYKRAPMGFQGMRGKKSLEEVLNDYEKRAPMGFQGMRGKKTYLVELPEEFEKRAMAMGFQGMRGKRDDFDVDWMKRAPMGFQGMRGKKSLRDEMEDLEKRVVMGFQGMRGKKDDLPGASGLSEFLEEYGKRAPIAGFQESMEKREEYEQNKRATMGFQGMRGKKNLFGCYFDCTVDNVDFEKRAPMGFQGMRGKKDSDKRAPMGFQGMRGKKSIVEVYGGGDKFDKGAPMVFQGMRGGKNAIPIQFEKRSPFGFFGTRGKKNPRWELRGKFVGVRGKKWASDEGIRLPESLVDNIQRLDDMDSTTTRAR